MRICVISCDSVDVGSSDDMRLIAAGGAALELRLREASHSGKHVHNIILVVEWFLYLCQLELHLLEH